VARKYHVMAARIRLESVEVGEKSPNCGAKYANFCLSKCMGYR